MITPKSIHEIFDWRHLVTGLQALQTNIIDIDLNISISQDDPRFGIVRPRIRLKINTETWEFLNSYYFMDDGILARGHRLSVDELELLKEYVRKHFLK